MLGLVTGYGRRRLGERGVGFVKDRLGDHEERGEEKVAEKRIAEEEERRWETRHANGHGLPPSGEGFRIVGRGDPGRGIGNQIKQT